MSEDSLKLVFSFYHVALGIKLRSSIVAVNTFNCWAICSGFFSADVIKHSDQKQLRGGEDLFILHFEVTLQFITEGNQGRDSSMKLKAGLIAISPCTFSCEGTPS